MNLNGQLKKSTYTFHVSGMHCKACEHLIEDELKEIEYVKTVDVSLSNDTVTISGEFGRANMREIVENLTAKLTKHGYTVSLEQKRNVRDWKDFNLAIPLAVGFVAFFIALQKMGIVNLIGAGEVSFSTVFIIGVVASLSTCMAVVGGLLLSMSATFAKDGSNTKPQVLFHVGRLVSFFLLGGVIGLIGTAFTLSTNASFVLGIVIGIVMLILGINLLDIFHKTKAFQLSMPRFVSNHALSISKFNHSFTPFLVGVVTFFLPCGFTQSMQVYTLSSGGFFNGGMTMFVFALGTLPVLALISFSSMSIQNSKYAGVFFKTAGLVVISFALMNIINSFVTIGVIAPVFSL
ncbi:MAG: sulfite exporter TauE/SafE family protein [Candidatus Pacebacteria bacterium]|nr:sulfite exporter TauE/SafE family protein [Candidatus Paceibacterota bacterium]MCF7857573.1 sulfite exporter TauE/SafE family protein [Candidatus Paceibacterota bacterium]